MIVILTFFAAAGTVFLKLGSDKLVFSIFHLISNTYLWLGILLYASASLIFLSMLRSTDLSYLYPLTSFTYVWVVLFSSHFLNEKINKYRLAGVFLILAGTGLINYK